MKQSEILEQLAKECYEFPGFYQEPLTQLDWNIMLANWLLDNNIRFVPNGEKNES